MQRQQQVSGRFGRQEAFAPDLIEGVHHSHPDHTYLIFATQTDHTWYLPHIFASHLDHTYLIFATHTDHTAGPYLIFATGTTGTGPVENNSTMWRNFILNAEIVHFSGVSCCREFVYFGGETFLVEIFYIVFGENVSHHFFWWRKSYKYNVCTRTARAAQCEWQLSWLDQSLLELSSLRLQYS